MPAHPEQRDVEDRQPVGLKGHNHHIECKTLFARSHLGRDKCELRAPDAVCLSKRCSQGADLNPGSATLPRCTAAASGITSPISASLPFEAGSPALENDTEPGWDRSGPDLLPLLGLVHEPGSFVRLRPARRCPALESSHQASRTFFSCQSCPERILSSPLQELGVLCCSL